jgi:hypothetical protein
MIDIIKDIQTITYLKTCPICNSQIKHIYHKSLLNKWDCCNYHVHSGDNTVFVLSILINKANQLNNNLTVRAEYDYYSNNLDIQFILQPNIIDYNKIIRSNVLDFGARKTKCHLSLLDLINKPLDVLELYADNAFVFC